MAGVEYADECCKFSSFFPSHHALLCSFPCFSRRIAFQYVKHTDVTMFQTATTSLKTEADLLLMGTLGAIWHAQGILQRYAVDPIA